MLGSAGPTTNLQLRKPLGQGAFHSNTVRRRPPAQYDSSKALPILPMSVPEEKGARLNRSGSRERAEMGSCALAVGRAHFARSTVEIRSGDGKGGQRRQLGGPTRLSQSRAKSVARTSKSISAMRQSLAMFDSSRANASAPSAASRLAPQRPPSSSNARKKPGKVFATQPGFKISMPAVERPRMEKLIAMR
jgi:hypothetical protein